MVLCKNAIFACAAGMSILAAAPVFADVDITGGSLRLLISGYANSSNQTPSLNLDRGYGTFTPGFGDQAFAIYTLNNSSFQIHDIHLARNAAEVSAATGTVNFTVTEDTYYSVDWNYNFTTTGNPAFASVEIILKNLDTNSWILYSYQTSSTGTGSLDLTDKPAIPAEVNGLLSPGTNYQLSYNMNIVSLGDTSGPTSADGNVSLIFSNTGSIPEPASIGILALAAGGLLLRRRQ